MANTARRQPAFWGILLVIIGVVLLVHKLDVLPLNWSIVISAGLAIVGLVMIIRKFKERGNSVFWWTLLFCYGTISFLRTTDLLAIPPWYGLPLALISIGIAIGVTVALRPRDWHLAVPAVLFLSVGAAILLTEMDMLEEEVVRSAISSYWPFALILFGAALLMNWRKKESVTS
jgi:hypothetical protein